MIKKILKTLGYVPLEDSQAGWAKYAQAEGLRERQEEETKKANAYIKELKTKLFLLENKQELPHPVVDIGLEDPAPTDVESRKVYVSQAAGFHTDILRKKIVSLLSDARGQFEQINRNTFGLTQSEYDLFLKGTINGLWLIHDWGEQMVNEVLSYQSENQELSEDEKKSLKAKIQE